MMAKLTLLVYASECCRQNTAVISLDIDKHLFITSATVWTLQHFDIEYIHFSAVEKTQCVLVSWVITELLALHRRNCRRVCVLCYVAVGIQKNSK